MGKINALYSELSQKYPKPVEETVVVDGKEWSLADKLQGRYYKNAWGKMTYLSGQLRVLEDNTKDFLLDDDFDFHLAIKLGTDRITNLVASNTTKRYQNTVELQTLHSRMQVSKSHFTHGMLYDGLKGYIEMAQERWDLGEHVFGVLPETKIFYFKHLKIYERGIQLLLKLDEEEQIEFLKSGVVTGTSGGYDVWNKQAKNKFPETFAKFCERQLGRRFEFTVFGILDACEAFIKDLNFPPFTLFYRTQGGTKKKVRAVFGGNVLAKAVGALMQACKNIIKQVDGRVVVQRSGLTEWIAWADWDRMFDEILKFVDRYLYYIDQGKNKNVLGEDFTGWDKQLHWRDYLFLQDYKGKMAPIMAWIVGLIAYAEVWTGTYRVGWIFFKSGHPFTSEFGSIKHYDLTLRSAKHNGFKVDGSIVLSDDNLMWVSGFDNEAHSKFLLSQGFTTNPAKDSDLAKNGSVEFLRVNVGRIHSESSSDFVGNIVSRYPGYAYLEREGEKRQVYKVSKSDDLAVDQVISKMASIGKYGGYLVEEILDITKETPLGKRVIATLHEFITSERSTEAYREDIVVGFKPEWMRLGQINIPRG